MQHNGQSKSKSLKSGYGDLHWQLPALSAGCPSTQVPEQQTIPQVLQAFHQRFPKHSTRLNEVTSSGEDMVTIFKHIDITERKGFKFSVSTGNEIRTKDFNCCKGISSQIGGKSEKAEKNWMNCLGVVENPQGYSGSSWTLFCKGWIYLGQGERGSGKGGWVGLWQSFITSSRNFVLVSYFRMFRSVPWWHRQM